MTDVAATCRCGCFGTSRTFSRSRWIRDEHDSAWREGGATAVAMETRIGGLGLSGICRLCKDGKC